MAGGQGTHATQNRLVMQAAVEAALGQINAGYGPDVLARQRARFLQELRERGHVVGHITDRHHELLAQCAELVARWDRLDRPRPCIGCQHLIGRPDDTHADSCPIPAIRAIVGQPMSDGS
jgi:hypothetical protein